MGNWWSPLAGLVNLVLDVNCPLCQRATGQGLCQDCTQQVQRCQLSVPQAGWHETPSVFAWGHYSGALKRTIAALKYHNQPELARPLGQWLAQAWIKSAIALPSPIVVPIPMHASKQQQRGFNQAELLADSFCAVTGFTQRRGLVRVQATAALFGQTAEARQQTLTNAFQLGQPFRQQPPKRSVLLLDDIYTTGATARSAMQTLQANGITVCGIVAVARTTKAK